MVSTEKPESIEQKVAHVYRVIPEKLYSKSSHLSKDNAELRHGLGYFIAPCLIHCDGRALGVVIENYSLWNGEFENTQLNSIRLLYWFKSSLCSGKHLLEQIV